MGHLTVFDKAGVFIGEYDSRPRILPSGYYVREQFKAGYAMWWRITTMERTTLVTTDQLPKGVKMTCLVLNLSL